MCCVIYLKINIYNKNNLTLQFEKTLYKKLDIGLVCGNGGLLFPDFLFTPTL